jgi:hypothetical protein
MKAVLRAMPLVILLACAAGAVHAGMGDSAPRARAAEALRDLRARLEGGESATATLAAWCGAHRLADPPVVKALRARDVDKPAPPAVRALLRAEPGEAVAFRHVRLVCGAHVLSEADNWYLPARLTAGMNARLETSDAPFGLVVAPLGFTRRTLAVETLFDPRTAAPGPPPRAILRLRAVLVTAAGAPFSVVVETYLGDLLAAEG